MKFNVKALVAAVALGVAGVATAAPLAAIGGPLNWKLQGTTTEYEDAAWGYGNESTWGIGEVTEINKTNGDPAWSKGEGGDYLYFMLYGVADGSVVPGGPFGSQIYNIGCTGGVGCDGKIHLDIYRHTSALSGILAQAPKDRTSFSGFTGVTDAVGSSLYLALELDVGKVLADVGATAFDELLTTLFQRVSSNTLPASGDGTFFASAVGGSAMAKWNTNGFNSGMSDFDGNFTLKPNFTSAGGSCVDGTAEADCFYGLVNDPVQSSAIPEPASLALVALGLLGAGVASRRRKQA